jgi:hypothetical protein
VIEWVVVVCALVEFVLLVSKQVAEDQVIWCFVNLKLEMWKYSERDGLFLQ